MADEEKEKPEVTKSTNALVFISHDTRDAELAEAFSALLKSVSAGVLKSFRTSDKKGNQGIEYGVEWYPEIIKNIQDASDVVCLLTERSVNRPWILFEAGMAKGKLGTPILGVALGIPLKEASSGPFAQFQNCGDDEGSLTKLVFQLVDRIPNSEPDEETIKFQVIKFKEAITKILKKKGNSKVEVSSDISPKDNSSAKLFEEIKVMFQDLPSRIQRNDPNKYRDRKHQSFHPRLLEEVLHFTDNVHTRILMMLGILRKEMPWIYEVGIETLRVIESKSSLKSKRQCLLDFQRIIELSTRNSSMHENLNSKSDYFFFVELPQSLIREMEECLIK